MARRAPRGVERRIHRFAAAALLLVLGAAHCADPGAPQEPLGETAQALAANVVTQHNDPGRTGAYTSETALTPALLKADQLVLQYTRAVDGGITTQPLYVSNVPCYSGFCAHNMVIVGTANNKLYAFDADDQSPSASPLWTLAFAPPALAPTRQVSTMDRCVPAGTNGLTSTPYISVSTNTLYIVSRDAAVSDGSVARFVLHAVDLRNGLEELPVGKEIQASVPQSYPAGGSQIFDPNTQFSRPGLLYQNGYIYVAFGAASCDRRDYHGWVMAYNAADISQQMGVFCAAPNFDIPGNVDGGNPGGAGIWQAGNGLVGDGTNVYFMIGNGPNQDYPSYGSLLPAQTVGGYGNAFVKLSQSFSALSVAGHYTPPDYVNLTANDVDLGSSGVVALPGGQIVGGGKNGYLQVLSTSGMTVTQRFQAFSNRMLPGVNPDSGEVAGPHLHGSPVFWQRSSKDSLLYGWAEKDVLRSFAFDNTTNQFKNLFSITPADGNSPSQAAAPYQVGDLMLGTSCWDANRNGGTCAASSMPGGFLSLSSNGDNDGILWTIVPEGDFPYSSGSPAWTVYFNAPGTTKSRMYAYDAETLQRIWSEPVPIGPGLGRYKLSKFVAPTIAAGRVFRPTFDGKLLVYGAGAAGGGGGGAKTCKMGAICGRGGAGVYCALSDRNAFVPQSLWQTTFSDANGWTAASEYQTLQFADINGDSKADVCGRGPQGIMCALSDGTEFGAATLWQGAFSDLNGWNSGPEYYSTIQLADVNGDGKADVCGRGSGGINCALSNGTSFGTVSIWQGAFKDANGWNSGPEYYSTIRFVDVNGDGKADVCGRGGGGINCALSNGTSFGTVSIWQGSYSDGNGWNVPQDYTTIQFANLDGDAQGKLDVCGRGSGGIWCALSNGTSFGAQSLWQSSYSNVNGWNGIQYYSTIRLADINGDGKADVCGRGAGGIWCATSNGTSFSAQSLWQSSFTDAAGWSDVSQYSTIQLVDVDGDGKADVCGRGSAGITCALSNGTSFGTATVWQGSFSDVNGWNGGAQFYSTIKFPAVAPGPCP